MRSGWFDVVYKDDDCFVLHIRDQKSEPPPEDKHGDDDSPGGNDDNSP